MAVIALAGGPVGASPAAADTTIKLTTSKDETTDLDGCSLREALMYAGGSTESDCATSAPSGTTTIIAPAGCYRLTMGELLSNPVSGPVVLQGAGPGPPACSGSGTVIDAQHDSRVLEVRSIARVNGLTVTGGVAFDGGGIRTDTGASLTLTDVAVNGNAGVHGIDATTNGGQGLPGGSGAGVYNGVGGTVNVVNSTISDNVSGTGGQGGEGSGTTGGDGGSGGFGGGIVNDTGGNMTVSASTITGNSAVTGRKVNARCVAQSHGTHPKHACVRAVAAGSLRSGGHAGINKILFQGRLTRTSRLSPGIHTVTVVATNALRQRSKPARLSFAIAAR